MTPPVIQAKFSGKSHQYETFAVAQKKAARKLVSLFPNTPFQSGRWLDIGAGPGILSSLKESPSIIRKAYLCDLSIPSLRQCSNVGSDKLISCDMDSLPFKENAFDGIISASALQWSQNITTLFQQMQHILKNSGTVALALLGTNTLQELRLLQKEFKIQTLTTYYSQDEIIKLCQQSNFSIKHVDSETYEIAYKTPREALTSLSKIGATGHKEKLLSPHMVKEFYKAYETLFTDKKCIHTYEYHYVLLRSNS